MAEQTEAEWPTCEQAGCIGIRLASAPMCLAHASEEETTAGLRMIGETGEIGNIFDHDAGIAQQFGSASGGDEFDSEGGKLAGEVYEAGFVGDA